MKSLFVFVVIAAAGCSSSSTTTQTPPVPKELSRALVADTAHSVFPGKFIEWETVDLLTVCNIDGSEVVRVTRTDEVAHDGYWPVGGWLIEGGSDDVARLRGILGGLVVKPRK